MRLDFLNTFWSSKKVLEVNVVPYLKWSSILIPLIYVICCSTIVVRYLLFVIRYSLFEKRFIKSASKTDLFYFLYKFKRYETAECPKRTERSINVQWTFIANGPACARCMDTIVKYLIEFKKLKVHLDFLNTF